MKNLKLTIVTGLSGSGKSTAVAALEDAGFFCVDNMPVALLPKFLELPVKTDTDIAGMAFVMDLREKNFLAQYPGVLNSLRRKGYLFSIIFLEADDNILLQRFSQTRRQHPLAHDVSLTAGIEKERQQLQDLRKSADRIIDTSTLNVHELKAHLLNLLNQEQPLPPLRINIQSFGFKYGIPRNADLIMDVRFLKNPYFVPELKNLSGENHEVIDFVYQHSQTKTFLGKYLDLLDYLIPLYQKEGKAYLTIAIGCTGGRHRSVVIAQAIFDHLKSSKGRIHLMHRDCERHDLEV